MADVCKESAHEYLGPIILGSVFFACVFVDGSHCLMAVKRNATVGAFGEEMFLAFRSSFLVFNGWLFRSTCTQFFAVVWTNIDNILEPKSIADMCFDGSLLFRFLILCFIGESLVGEFSVGL